MIIVKRVFLHFDVICCSSVLWHYGYCIWLLESVDSVLSVSTDFFRPLENCTGTVTCVNRLFHSHKELIV